MLLLVEKALFVVLRWRERWPREIEPGLAALAAVSLTARQIWQQFLPIARSRPDLVEEDRGPPENPAGDRLLFLLKRRSHPENIRVELCFIDSSRSAC